MSWRDTVNTRSVFLVLMILVGLCYGIYEQFNKEIYSPKPKQKTIITPCGEMLLPKIGIGTVEIEEFALPQYGKDGFRTSEITAEKITWSKDNPIELTKPVIYEFGPDGITVTRKMSGNYESIEANMTDREIKSVRVWENVNIVSYEKESIKEK